MEEKEAEIKVVRLVTGEDIIASIVENEFLQGDESYVTYVFVEPLKIVYTINPETGMISVGLIQWFFSKLAANDSFEIDPKDILTMAEPSAQMIEYYNSTLAAFNQTSEISKNENGTFVSPNEGPQLLNELLNQFAKKKKSN